LTAAGCLDADQGTLIVAPQKTARRQASAVDLVSSRATTNRSALSVDDPDLNQELAKVDELLRTAGAADDDLAAPSAANGPRGVVQAAFAEEPAPVQKAAHKPGRANRLAKESSPYLLLHAHNPVDWYPWGPEAFAKAAKENKLIFLSIGYSSCHWCHVMERLVFSDEEIAKYMNEHFVCIKVDREERPDIDDVYMTALSVYFRLSGSDQNGGWPLSMFITPDGKPIAGGTYFPPADVGGRMGFPSVMRRISELWRDDQEALKNNAEILTTNVRRVMSSKVVLSDTPLTVDLANSVVTTVAQSHDSKFGGFDFHPSRANAPKFPVPSKLSLLLYKARRDRDQETQRKVLFTLDAMAAGGIRDHLAGGFHRYSTDREWKVPHFEKMLYDNAQLADVYVEAFQQTKHPQYRLIAEEICDFVLRDMTDERGGFFAALDADSEEVEGKSYVWSEAEISKLLNPADAEAFKWAYGLRERNTFEAGFVLHQPQPLSEVAKTLKIAPDELERRMAHARQVLLQARNRRSQPLLDDKILAGWNGLMIRALANVGANLNRPDYVAAAEKGAMFVASELRDRDGRLHRSFRGSVSPIKAYLDDYAYLVEGMIALHLATRDQKWLNAASKLTDDQIELFWDEQHSGFFFTAHDQEELLARSKDRYDSVVPSGNSVAVRNLIRLAELTGNTAYRDKAEAILKSVAGSMQESPGGFANMALGLFEFLDRPRFGASNSHPDPHVVTVGADEVMDVAANVQRPSGSRVRPADDSTTKKSDKSPTEKKSLEILTAEAHLNVDRLPAGASCRIALVLNIKEGWHINQNPPANDFQMPTVFTMKTKLGSKLLNVKYPKGHKFDFPGFDEPLMVYEGQIVLFGTIEVPQEAAGQHEELELNVKYQACSSDRCEPPRTLKLTGKVEVAAVGEPVKTINDKLFNPPKPATTKNLP
jgi:uncharacterized protein YyaL (SSP411 family)